MPDAIPRAGPRPCNMDQSQRTKRTSNACQRCRSRKVKCSGTQPCDKCSQRRQECVFEEDRKITVSEELFLSLRRRVEELEGSSPQPPRKRARTLGNSSPDALIQRQPSEGAKESILEPPDGSRYDDRFASNPLVSPSTYVKHTGRRQRIWLFLGPTSTWSFSRRVLSNIQTRLNPNNPKPIPLAVDGDAYQIHWRRASSDEAPDISGLPSLEHALYIHNTVQFHFGHLYQMFDEKEFLQHLYGFYENAAVKVQENRIWYIQFLIVLAFGDAFLAPVRKSHNTAGWTKYFSRAMSLLPDTGGLWHDPTLAIEVLALIALYLHSVDMRDTAYCYIGHAMRMCLVEGFHRALPVEQLGQKLVDRCSNICPDGKLGGRFLRKVRSVLHEMTDLSRELENVFAHRFSNSVDALSGVTTRLTLSCHLCIIVTTRPLVLSLLWERLSCFEEGDVFRTLSSPVRTLLEACTDSATKSLRILCALRDQNILETFLPFDLENLFSSFFVLSLISAILPDTLPDPNYREIGFNLLDDMIARGNRVAQLRKSEIELLEELVQPLIRSQAQPPQGENPRSHLVAPVGENRVAGLENALPALYVGSSTPALPSNEEDLPFDWRELGLSMDHMLSVTDQLDANNLILDAEREGLQTDLWLWSDA
ncbi:putative C6 transcription factor [Aspergillus tanneri]|uniref:Zn(2)-C6 fungal-type domain-containing protein n=1 Tax=Aspergillus tanneri TaxID=1220188 RepID=A0A5M9M9M6_9EURO|nr:uncharacterized protein ATNIH1004_010954 [Aspergillus tanneri]KAA8642014.1 hypothetical protein ATNIH1004_010954 [Aspergillus tanneri]